MFEESYDYIYKTNFYSREERDRIVIEVNLCQYVDIKRIQTRLDRCVHEATWHRFVVGESATTLKVKVKDDEDGDDVEEVRGDW